jgi:hypothetical protein
VGTRRTAYVREPGAAGGSSLSAPADGLYWHLALQALLVAFFAQAS